LACAHCVNGFLKQFTSAALLSKTSGDFDVGFTLIFEPFIRSVS
jgi:hypothetical protein